MPCLRFEIQDFKANEATLCVCFFLGGRGEGRVGGVRTWEAKSGEEKNVRKERETRRKLGPNG